MPPSTPLLAPPSTTDLARLRPLQVGVIPRADPSAVAPRPPPQLNPPLPVLLAGPIVRRSEPAVVWIWVATSGPVAVEGRVMQRSGGSVSTIGSGRADAVQIGARLFITLVPIRARSAYPFGVVLSYDLTFHAAPGWEFHGAVGLTPRDRVVYAGMDFPTFFLGPGPAARTARIVHGSCSKLHGEGASAMRGFDQELGRVIDSVEERPSAFLMTGDQIYADDVEWRVLRASEAASALLIGTLERLPIEVVIPSRGATPIRYPPQLDMTRYPVPASEVTRGRYLMQQSLGTAEWHNHLMTFGEYCASYLLTLSDALWSHAPLRAFSGELPGAEATARITSRVLANMTTYMIFDDHDVTDDWPYNLTATTNVREHNTNARWVLACAMASAWYFQMLGNTGSPDAEFDRVTDQYWRAQRSAPQDAPQPELPDYFLLGVDEFTSRFAQRVNYNFVAPTVPPIAFMDTHTQRQLYDDYPPALLSNSAARTFGALLDSMQPPAGAPLMVVSPTPIIGPDPLVVWMGQVVHLAAHRPGVPLSPDPDPDFWLDNPEGLREILQTLSDHTAGTHRRVVVFSGDYHFGYTVATSVIDAPADNPNQLRAMGLYQLVSSPVKNQMTADQRRNWERLDVVVGGWTSQSLMAWIQTDDTTHPAHRLLYHSRGADPGLNPGQFVRQGSTPFMLHRFLGDSVVDNHVGFATVSWAADGAVTLEHRFLGSGGWLPGQLARSAGRDPDQSISHPSSW